MLSFANASAADYQNLGRQIVTQCKAYASHEEVSKCVVRSLYQAFGPADDPELALVRIYRLVPVTHLLPELGHMVDGDERFVMALTGTYGMLEAWQDRRRSANHRVIPIKRIAIEKLSPMFEEILANGMGVDFDRLYQTGDVVASTTGLAGMFYVPDVSQSPQHIPAQDDFVRPYGIQSEIGFGGLIKGEEETFSLYTLFAFSRVPISAQAAHDFCGMRSLLGTALASKTGQTIFEEDGWRS